MEGIAVIGLDLAKNVFQVLLVNRVARHTIRCQEVGQDAISSERQFMPAASSGRELDQGHTVQHDRRAARRHIGCSPAKNVALRPHGIP